MLAAFGSWWAGQIYDRAAVILAVTAVVAIIALKFAVGVSVSTRLEELMPEEAKSVQTLNDVLQQTGSFASMQIVAHASKPEEALSFVNAAKAEIDTHVWVQYSQNAEDVEVLARHKLLLLNEAELLDLEREVGDAYPAYFAQKLSDAIGAKVSVAIRDRNLKATSDTDLDEARLDDLTESLREPPEKERVFTSKDGQTAVLVVWPKSGLEGLGDAKRMVEDARRVAQTLQASYGDSVRTGVAGRIANKVAQFDAVTRDLKLGLISAITLIAVLIGVSYRSVIAVPLILVPLAIGLIWTFAGAAIVIGGLNLITVFLILILFGLGIDYGIHNLSRYREERRKGVNVAGALEVVVLETGAASLIAALTTSFGFLSLLLTKFRAFSEFGFIAGTGVILIFISMYSVFPALVVVVERITPRVLLTTAGPPGRNFAARTSNKLIAPNIALSAALVAILIAAIFAPRLTFERNFKNLEASQPASLVWATTQVNQVFGSSHDRAILAVETLDEVEAVERYFKSKIETDLQSPTIEKVSSISDFIPPEHAQRRRLNVIRRLEQRADELRHVDQGLYASAKQYLDIDTLEIDDLPYGLRRTFVGVNHDPVYLIYIYNLVSMDDSALARQFYDDAARFKVGEREYFSASEGFVFVEMIALMKADAVKAILLVTITTALLVLAFMRSLVGAAIVLAPPILGVFITIGVMGATGLSLSIMNMVILPSLIGISVDNAIHIYHRADHAGARADIPAIMQTTGRAAVLTTMTTLIGFGGLITASMGGLRSMGALAIIGFTVCLAMTWVVLPNLLELQRHRSQKVEGHCAAN